MNRFNLLDAPGHLLRRNQQRSYEIFTRHVGSDVTRQQMALLVALAKMPGASQKHLVEATGMDKGTLKEMIGRMIIKGWIARERAPSDSRAWAMKITTTGEELLENRLDAVVAAQQEILAPLPEADREAFIRSLQTLLGYQLS